MADRRRNAGGNRNPGKHGWLRFDRYQVIHERALERHGFVVEDRTVFTRIVGSGSIRITLEGVVVCQAGIVIDVTKLLEVRTVRGREEVRGLIYRYNAHRRGGFNLLRYDNQHADTPEEFHRHEFDARSGLEVSRTVLERADVPTLIEVVAEVEAHSRAAGLV